MAIPTNLSVAAVSYNGTGIPLVGIVPSGTTQINVSSNGTITEDVTNYAYAQVVASVPASAVDSGTKSISSNGTHDVIGYASANVSVPNSYSAGDEGKVVSNGALVAQGSDTVTQNGTVDTTLINSITVNVSGSSVLSGSFTPDSNILTKTFDIGSCTHFLIFATSNVYSSSETGRRSSLAYVDFERTMNLMIASNSSGNAAGANSNTTKWGTIDSCFSKSGSTLTISSSGSSTSAFNYFIKNITYQWYAW